MTNIQQLLNWFDKSKGVSTDTRSLLEGQLYFALKGDNFDGNQYAKKALETGALLAVVDDASVCKNDKYLLVDDVLTALQELSNIHRKRFDIPVFAITGTNGKTTTKELLTSVISQKFVVHATRGNLNNHIGVPLTLLGLRANHQFLVLEMGASAEGEIRDLCVIAEPTAGLITNIGKAHIEGFGDVATIARTKSELYDYLETNGQTIFMSETLFQNDHFASRSFKNLMLFSPAKMRGTTINNLVLCGNEPAVKIEVEDQVKSKYMAQSNLFGDYNFANLTAVLKIADFYKLTIDHCIRGIESYLPSNNRSQITRDMNDNMIVMDAYNANPSSVHAALDHFVKLVGGKDRYVILGDMLELGNVSVEEHLEVIHKITKNPEICFILVGREFSKAIEVLGAKLADHILFFDQTEMAKVWWNSKQIKKSMILVKGSRGIALEKIFND
jgi:UDP-N-acetylmuramoyl-tripeptide--D-alanyl-D-alanine ligase